MDDYCDPQEIRMRCIEAAVGSLGSMIPADGIPLGAILTVAKAFEAYVAGPAEEAKFATVVTLVPKSV